MHVNVDDIVADPASNCRLDVDENALNELVASIREHGLIHQLNVRHVDGRYLLVTGFRRLAACRILGWQTVPCHVLDITEEEARFINLEENLARHDLNPLEEALTLERLFPEAEYSSRSEVISSKLCRSQHWVVDRRRILKLSPAHQQLVANCKIPVGRVSEILNSDHPNDTAYKIATRSSTKPRTTPGKSVRSRRAIKNLIENLRAVHINGLAVHCLSWTVGQTSTEELTEAIAAELKCPIHNVTNGPGTAIEADTDNSDTATRLSMPTDSRGSDFMGVQHSGTSCNAAEIEPA